jgi:5-methylcytosine-specific restriction protein A
VDAIFQGVPAAKRCYIDFLAADIERLSMRHRDRWSVTLFEENKIRLNVGWVECLTLYPERLQILVKKTSARPGTKFDGVNYPRAPRCDMTTLSLPELPATLPSLTESHWDALFIATNWHLPPGRREAHSTGVTAYLSRVLRRQIPEPSYLGALAPDPLDEIPPPEAYVEGGRISGMANRYERDPKARERCIEHHGSRCSVCGMAFKERYGGTMEGFIHVHHLKPLSEVGGKYRLNPLNDLRPVCPNCHAVIHSKNPPLSIEQARALLSH